MRRLTRYILWELSKVFVLTLTGLTLLMLLVVVGQEAIRQGLGPVPILRLMPYLMPNALLFAVPGAILLAACSVMGGMSASNEIVALKSLGIPPSVVLWPTLFTGFFLSLVAVWINDVAVSWGRQGAHRVVLHSLEEIVYSMLRTKRSYSSNRFSINVKQVQGRKLIQPTLSFYPKDDTQPIIVTAREAELRLNPERDSLSILLTDSEGDFGNNLYAVDPDTFEYEIPLSAASRKGDLAPSPSFYPLWRIPRETKTQKEEIRRLEQTYAAEAALQMITGDIAGLSAPEWQQQLDSIRFAESRLHRLHTEPWRRWANGFSCFFFILVGAPLAIRLRNADMWTTFGLCFLPILFFYYPFLLYGGERAKSGDLPPYAVWLGNLVLLAVGSAFIRRVIRY